MLKPNDVNEATLRQAVDDLEIGVPIRSWEVRDGKLYLHLAYSHAPAVWSPAAEAEEPPAPSQHVPTVDNTPIPDNLSRLLKSDLQTLARIYRIHRWSKLRKAELVAELEEIREGEPHDQH